MRRNLRVGRGCRGMTLMETLAAVLILSLLSVLILSGSHAALSVYEKSTFASESQNVSKLIDTALSDVLRYAQSVAVDEQGNVTAYTNSAYGVRNGRICVGTGENDRGMLYLNSDPQDPEDRVPLLSNLSYAGLCVVPADDDPAVGGDSTFSLTYSDGVFSGSYRLYRPAGGLLSQIYQFHYRSINSIPASRASD